MLPEGAKLAFPDHPQIARGFTDILQGFKDTPHLSGMTSVALATGIAKDVLKGKYFDVQHDLGDVLMQASAITANPSLYTLGVSFPGGLPNDGGTELLNAEVPYDFPSL